MTEPQDEGVDYACTQLVRAMDNPNVHIFAHPSGRQINGRPAYEVDWERVFEAAVERGCFMEINAQPDRLDLDDTHAQMAKEMGLKLATSSVSGETDYVVAGPGAGSKLDEARERDLPVLDEEEFLELIEERQNG